MNTTPKAIAPAPVINEPWRVPPVRRTFWGAVTAVFWLVYLYLWMPLITLVLWLFGIKRAYGELYLRQNTIEPFLLTALPIIALVATLILLSWAEYNRVRFRGVERRNPMKDIALRQIAVELGATVELGERMQQSKAITLHMNSDAIPVGLTDVYPAATIKPTLAAAASSRD